MAFLDINYQVLIGIDDIDNLTNTMDTSIEMSRVSKEEVGLERKMTSRALHLTGLGVEPSTVRLAVLFFESFSLYLYYIPQPQ